MGIRTSNSRKAPNLTEMKPSVSFCEAGHRSLMWSLLPLVWRNHGSLLISTPGSVALIFSAQSLIPKETCFPAYRDFLPDSWIPSPFLLCSSDCAFGLVRNESIFCCRTFLVALALAAACLLLRAAHSLFILYRSLFAFILKPATTTWLINEHKY